MTKGKSKRGLKRPQPEVTAERTFYPELDTTLAEMQRLIQEGLANRRRFLDLEAWTLTFLKNKGIKTYEGLNHRATAVRPLGEEIDWEGVRKAIGPDLWEEILGPPQPDKGRFEALIELGRVDLEKILPYISEKEIKPSVRLTRRPPGGS
jgi:hypothetical protein